MTQDADEMKEREVFEKVFGKKPADRLDYDLIEAYELQWEGWQVARRVVAASAAGKDAEDAARYRWLVENEWTEEVKAAFDLCAPHSGNKHIHDAAIDEAMGRDAEGEKR